MNLSRIQLNPARRQGRRLLASPQAMHAAVLASFPEPDDERGRTLWRVDHDGHVVQLYVLSRSTPDFSHLVEQAGWQTRADTWATRAYAPLLNRVEEGTRWAFRLTANPTRTVDKKRFGHVTVAQQLQWLVSRSERWGFSIPVDEATSAPVVTVRDRAMLQFRRAGSRVTIARATFEGALLVTDAAAMRDALVMGFGHAKAYGCGLMTLAAPRER